MVNARERERDREREVDKALKLPQCHTPSSRNRMLRKGGT